MLEQQGLAHLSVPHLGPMHCSPVCLVPAPGGVAPLVYHESVVARGSIADHARQEPSAQWLVMALASASPSPTAVNRRRPRHHPPPPVRHLHPQPAHRPPRDGREPQDRQGAGPYRPLTLQASQTRWSNKPPLCRFMALTSNCCTAQNPVAIKGQRTSPTACQASIRGLMTQCGHPVMNRVV